MDPPNSQYTQLLQHSAHSICGWLEIRILIVLTYAELSADHIGYGRIDAPQVLRTWRDNAEDELSLIALVDVAISQ